MVHQELSLAPDLSVAENILAGRQPRRGWLVDWRRLHERAKGMLAEFCPAVDAAAPVASLNVGYRQVVEILKAVASGHLPVIMAGGPKSDDPLAIFRQLHQAMTHGASGAAIGRRVWGSDDPVASLEAIRAIVLGGASADEAVAIYQGGRETGR